MPRRLLLLAASTVAACASNSEYAVFVPAVPGREQDRVQRATFSIVAPAGFDLRAEDDGNSLWFREAPPDNGRHRLYRWLEVRPVAAVPDDEPEGSSERALAVLRERHAADDLEVRETGPVRLADRDGHFLVGRKRGPAAGWFLEVLEFYVPGDEHGLVVGFTVPDGQLAASRSAFTQTAATLRTTLGLPKAGAAGPMLWHDDHHFGFRLPADWELQADPQGQLAVYAHPSGAQCDVSAHTSGGGHDLDRLLTGYAGDQAASMPGITLLATEWRRIGGNRALRFVAAYRDGTDTVVVDDLFVVQDTKLYRVLFRIPKTGFDDLRGAIGKAVASVRIE